MAAFDNPLDLSFTNAGMNDDEGEKKADGVITIVVMLKLLNDVSEKATPYVLN